MAAVATGCGNPISNAVFIEEARFLSALPSAERLGPPELLLSGGDESDSDLLAAGRGAAGELQDFVAIPIGAGSALRETAPDLRTETSRLWDSPVRALAVIEGDPIPFWLHAEVLKLESGDYGWTLEISTEEDGPYAEVALGSHDANDTDGEFSWDIALSAEILDVGASEDLAPMEVNYIDHDAATDEREVSIETSVGLVPQAWGLGGLFGMSTIRQVQITEDGLDWLAQFSLVQTSEGGRADGVLFQTPQRPFEACWGPDGTTEWQRVDGEDAVPAGTFEFECSLPDVFDGA